MIANIKSAISIGRWPQAMRSAMGLQQLQILLLTGLPLIVWGALYAHTPVAWLFAEFGIYSLMLIGSFIYRRLPDGLASTVMLLFVFTHMAAQLVVGAALSVTLAISLLFAVTIALSIGALTSAIALLGGVVLLCGSLWWSDGPGLASIPWLLLLLSIAAMMILNGTYLRILHHAADHQQHQLLTKLQDTRQWLDDSRQHSAVLRFQIEREVEQRTAHLERINRDMRDANQHLEAFNYMVSHDMRASLRVVDGFSKILTDEISGSISSEAQHMLARMQTAIQHMQGMVSELLVLSKGGAADVRKNKVDLSAMVAEVARDLQLLEPQRAVELHIDAGMQVCADAELMREVISNLLGNAWKFTSVCKRACIRFGMSEGAGETIYYVRDNGAGFDMSRVAELFQPFHRLHSHEEFEGSGIGLATVKRIVERHGGRVWATSNPDQGAKICFTLGESCHEEERKSLCG